MQSKGFYRGESHKYGRRPDSIPQQVQDEETDSCGRRERESGASSDIDIDGKRAWQDRVG